METQGNPPEGGASQDANPPVGGPGSPEPSPGTAGPASPGPSPIAPPQERPVGTPPPVAPAAPQGDAADLIRRLTELEQQNTRYQQMVSGSASEVKRLQEQMQARDEEAKRYRDQLAIAINGGTPQQAQAASRAKALLDAWAAGNDAALEPLERALTFMDNPTAEMRKVVMPVLDEASRPMQWQQYLVDEAPKVQVNGQQVTVFEQPQSQEYRAVWDTYQRLMANPRTRLKHGVPDPSAIGDLQDPTTGQLVKVDYRVVHDAMTQWKIDTAMQRGRETQQTQDTLPTVEGGGAAPVADAEPDAMSLLSPGEKSQLQAMWGAKQLPDGWPKGNLSQAAKHMWTMFEKRYPDRAALRKAQAAQGQMVNA